jgi:tetratricopeptide (TPR) repeat protein
MTRCVPLFVLLLVLPSAAFAQQDRFLGTLPALYRSLAGAYGDEGPEITAFVETLSEALATWDRNYSAAQLDLRASLKGGDPRTALQVHVTLSGLHAERSRFQDALAEIDAAIRINPKLAALHRYRALLFQAVGRSNDAADAYRAAWQLDSTDPLNAYRLVVQRSRQTSNSEIEKALATLSGVERELVRGQRRLTEAPFLVLTPVNDDVGRAMPFAPAAYARPFALLLKGEFAEGMAALKAAAAADPLIADPALRLEPMSRGIAFLHVEMVAEAIASLEAATAAAPASSEAQRMLGTAYAVNGDMAKAVEHLRIAVKLNPKNERAWLTLARTLEGVDKAEEASQVLRDAVGQLPDAGAVRWLLSTLSPQLQRSDETDVDLISVADRLVMLAGKGELYARVAALAQSHLDYDRAVNLLEQRVAVTPNNPGAHYALGRAFIEDGRDAAGYAELVIALLLDPDGTDTLATLGRVHLAARRYAAAAEALEKAAATQPSDAEILRALSDALVQSGRTEEGRKRLEEAGRAQAAAVEEQRRLRTFGMLGAQATLSMQRGEFEQAIDLWHRVIELDPGNAGHQLRLSEALVGARRLADAEATLRMAITLGGGAEAHRRLIDVLAALGRADESARERQLYREQRLQELRARSGAGR